MAKVRNGVETLPKMSIVWVGCTNVTDKRQTTDRQADGRRSLQIKWLSYFQQTLIKKEVRTWIKMVG